jgi:type 2 lantibiotic biosynthesis protein LanM
MNTPLSEPSQAAATWWQHPGWYRAVTLSERIASRSAASAHRAGSGTGKREKAEKRLQAWKAQAPFQSGSYFAERLALDGITEPDLLLLLDEPIEDVQARLSLPDWLNALRQAFEGQASEDALPGALPEPDKKNPAAAFLASLQPLLAKARRDLLSGIDALLQHYSRPPFDREALVSSLLAGLSRQLLSQVSRTYALELKVAGTLGRLCGTTPQERFESFAQRLTRPEVILPLLEEYCVLARALVLMVDQWLAFSLEFLGHFCADWPEIRQHLLLEDEDCLLVEVESDAGDRHRDGRSVLLLKFRSGSRLVYKPKSLAIDQHFQELLKRLNAYGAQPEFQTFKVLDKGTYGWAEFVAFRDCVTTEEVRRFYERQGAYLALLYALEATDMHAGNLIAAGEHPMLVDLETLFHPRVETDNSLFVEEPAFAAFWHSAIRVGLLPLRLWGNEDAPGVNISGLGGEEGQMTPRPVPQWADGGTDQMRLVRTRIELPARINHPRLNGQQIDMLAYADSILAGFRRMYRLFMEHRHELLTEILPRFAQDEIRFIARPTDIYGRFIYDSFRPELLRDALERDRHFDRLWVGIQWQPHMTRLIPAERADLLKGDVPFFTTRVACRDLLTSRGEATAGFFQESGLSQAQKRISLLDEADLARQEWIINASFACLVRDTSHGGNRTPSFHPKQTRVNRARLLKAASALGDALEKAAVWGEGTAGWLSIGQMNEHEWGLQPAGLDLYNGLPGIVLFLAYLAALTGEERYRRLAAAALQNIRMQLKHPQQEALGTVGAFSGLGGLLYLFSHLGRLWEEPALFQQAAELAQALPGLVERDEQFDIIAGSAGCIAGLLSLYAVAPSPDILRMALCCGDRLRAGAQPMQVGIGWKIPREAVPLAGFAHGAAGIALSLLRLAAVSGERHLHQAALAALAYERSLFAPDEHNWLDLRNVRMRSGQNQTQEGEARYFMTAWCNGATGIGLARLASLPYLNDAHLHKEIDAALKSTLAQSFAGDYTLCHGSAGYLETLLVASQTLDAAPYQAALEQGASVLLEKASAFSKQAKVFTEIEPPGFMVGLAGLGYTLLRFVEPAAVPSALLLAPPVPAERT